MTCNLQSEEHQLLTVLPPEIWQKVLGHVTTRKCYQKASSTSPYIKTLLLPYRTKILFAEVLPFLLQSHQPCTNMARILRQVCRSWKKSVDNYAVQQPLNFISQLMHSNPSYEELNFHEPESFGCTTNFTKFEQHFDSSHLKNSLNPFLYRSVDIYPEMSQNSLEANITAMYNFLDKYGTHIWFLDIYAHVSNLAEHQTIMEMLPCCLSRMPNLKSISFGMSGLDIREQQNHILQHIPVFPVLRDLYFVSLNGLPLSVYKSFARANSNVKVVDNCIFVYRPELTQFCLEDWPNLTAVEIRLRAFDRSFETFETARVICPLKTLKLCAQDLIDVSWERVFVALEQKFGGTLEQLYLSLPNIKGDSPELKLSKLKILDLLLPTFVRLDFLVPMVDTLEDFSLAAKKRTCTNDFDHGLLDLFNFWDNPEKSNMWKLFPKLKLIKTCKRYRFFGEKTWSVSARYQWKDTQKES